MPARAGQIGAMQPHRHTLTLFLPDPDASAAFARRLADLVPPGACLLLSGPIGAGKSHIARAFIRHRLGYEGDIPSPTFTLVQTYESPEVEIWHADLYRLSHPDEVLELGLDQAMGRAICLIEWPDRLGILAPAEAIHLTLALQGEGRSAELSTLDGDLARQLRNA